MAKTYTTSQGDTWDLIAYKLYGAERYMQQLYEANWPLSEVLIFSSGTVINVPDIEVEDEGDQASPFWRSGTDEYEEPYSSTVSPYGEGI